MKKVSVVILNYKVKDLTIRCIKSIRNSTYKNLEIIVVDNNSQDGIEEDLSNNKDIIFIQTGDNSGYSGGNNIGIKRALALDADMVFVLNPDTEVEKDTLKNLVDAIDQQRVGVVGPKILFADGKTIWCAGGKLDLLNVIGGNRGIDEVDNGQYDKVEEVDFISGCAMLVKKEVFEEIGFLDESYFMYYEDDDFSYRAKNAGFKLLFVPSAVVYHGNAKSSGPSSLFQDYYLTRNRMIFASKFLPFRTRFALFREALRNIGNPIRRQAFFDFFMGKLGKGDI